MTNTEAWRCSCGANNKYGGFCGKCGARKVVYCGSQNIANAQNIAYAQPAVKNKKTGITLAVCLLAVLCYMLACVLVFLLGEAVGAIMVRHEEKGITDRRVEVVEEIANFAVWGEN